MESPEKEIGSQQKLRSEERVMEMMEEKVHSLMKICFEGSHHLEAQEKETVPVQKFKVHLRLEEVTFEKGSRMETKEKRSGSILRSCCMTSSTRTLMSRKSAFRRGECCNTCIKKEIVI